MQRDVDQLLCPELDDDLRRTVWCEANCACVYQLQLHAVDGSSLPSWRSPRITPERGTACSALPPLRSAGLIFFTDMIVGFHVGFIATYNTRHVLTCIARAAACSACGCRC